VKIPGQFFVKIYTETTFACAIAQIPSFAWEMLVSGDSGEQPEMGLAMSKSVRAGGNIWISASSLLDVGYHSVDGSAPDSDASEFSGLAEM
jgi:hypothetical protein